MITFADVLYKVITITSVFFILNAHTEKI